MSIKAEFIKHIENAILEFRDKLIAADEDIMLSVHWHKGDPAFQVEETCYAIAEEIYPDDEEDESNDIDPKSHAMNDPQKWYALSISFNAEQRPGEVYRNPDKADVIQKAKDFVIALYGELTGRADEVGRYPHKNSAGSNYLCAVVEEINPTDDTRYLDMLERAKYVRGTRE